MPPGTRRKIYIGFFDFFWVICRFSINIRIEVHLKYTCFICNGKWKDTGLIVATLIVKITLNVKNFTLRVNDPPLM